MSPVSSCQVVSGQYLKKMNRTDDIASWDGWEFFVRSKECNLEGCAPLVFFNHVLARSMPSLVYSSEDSAPLNSYQCDVWFCPSMRATSKHGVRYIPPLFSTCQDCTQHALLRSNGNDAYNCVVNMAWTLDTAPTQ